jgi:hypothetical protein
VVPAAPAACAPTAADPTPPSTDSSASFAMPTFSELQQQLTQAKQRKAILLMLIEYIDENFLPKGGQDPEQKLLDEDRLPVPLELLEAVAADTLTAEVAQLDAQINQIISSNLVAAPGPEMIVTPAVVSDSPEVVGQEGD